jgi:hypothetical protein
MFDPCFALEQVRRTENSDDLKGLSGSVDGSQASVVTLGDTMEESLLSVLIALGVMHSPEDKVRWAFAHFQYCVRSLSCDPFVRSSISVLIFASPFFNAV